jgi:hypothetical protein
MQSKYPIQDLFPSVPARVSQTTTSDSAGRKILNGRRINPDLAQKPLVSISLLVKGIIEKNYFKSGFRPLIWFLK